MKLSKLFKLNQESEEQKQFFLAVEISLDNVKSALWTVDAAKTKIIKTGSIEEWDGQDKDTLLKAVDVSITNACQKIDQEPQGIIFGLPEDWVAENQIKAEKKELLKFISFKLDLKPLGFVVVLESLLAYLKDKEGTPVNAIIINLQADQSLISLVRLGKIKGTQVVGRSDDLAADVKEGLARFKKAKDFPARMIVFNGLADLEEYKQQLTSFDWVEELSFLHFPKVESLASQESVRAIALAGGAELAKSLGFEIKREEEKTAKTAPASAPSFGFIAGQDITEVSQPAEKSSKGRSRPEDGRPLVESPGREELEKKEVELEPEPQTAEPESSQGPSPGQESTSRQKLFSRSPKFPSRSLLSSFLSPLKALLSLRKVAFKFWFLLPLPVLIIGLIFFFIYIPKAKITLYFEPKILEKELKITIDPDASSIDVDAKVVPATLEGIEVEGSLDKSATGQKIIGEKAKGEAVLFNKTDLPKVFPGGTVLVGSDDLAFVLDEEVEVASRSAEEEGISFGKSSVAITAASIGIEYNLGSETKLTFKEYPDSVYSAKTDEGLSGGTSREVKVVSEDDLDSLLSDLKSKLQDEAIAKLKDKSSPDTEIFTDALEEEIISQKFSAEADEETDHVNLKLKVKFSGFVYQENNLKELMSNLVKDEIPDGFVFDPSKTKIQIEKLEAEEDKDKIKVQTTIKAYLIPKTNFEEIKKSLAGQPRDKIKDYLKTLSNFSQADVTITPRFSKNLKTLPRLTKNITIEIKVEDE